MIHCYKVVEDNGTDTFHSFYVRGKARTTYKVGKTHTGKKWLTSQGYYPTIFMGVNEAWNYIKANRDCTQRCAILVVAIREADILSELPPFASTYSLEGGLISTIYAPHLWPLGTKMVKKLRVVHVFCRLDFRESSF